MSYQQDPEYVRLAEKVASGSLANITTVIDGNNLQVNNKTHYPAAINLTLIQRGYFSSKTYEQRIQVGACQENTFDFEFPVEKVNQIDIDYQVKCDQNRMKRIQFRYTADEELEKLGSRKTYRVESDLDGNQIAFTCKPGEILNKVDLVADMPLDSMERLVNYCKLDSSEFAVKSEIVFGIRTVNWTVKVIQIES